jgi:RNA polymerase sigma-70 factor (ECF subfamily)
VTPRPVVLSDADYDALREQIGRSVASVCPGWLAADREDIVQAVLTRVIDIVRRDEWKAPPSASYLWKAAFNATIDEIRRVRRRREQPIDDVTRRDLTAAQPDPERLARTQQMGRAIHDCLTRLNRDRRLAVTLVLQGDTAREAAGRLDWSIKKVENLVFRGMHELRECLTSKGWSA